MWSPASKQTSEATPSAFQLSTITVPAKCVPSTCNALHCTAKQWVRSVYIVYKYSDTTLSHLTATAHTHTHHKWLWLHLSALYTVNKGIPIWNRNARACERASERVCVFGMFSFNSFGCLIIQRLNYDLDFLSIHLSCAYLTDCCTVAWIGTKKNWNHPWRD